MEDKKIEEQEVKEAIRELTDHEMEKVVGGANQTIIDSEIAREIEKFVNKG